MIASAIAMRSAIVTSVLPRAKYPRRAVRSVSASVKRERSM